MSAGFRAPTDPALVLPERRPPVLANTRGHGNALLRNQMQEAASALFDAQDAAYRAGLELCNACYLASSYGLRVPHEPVIAWEMARDELAFRLGLKFTTPTITNAGRTDP